jgi:hypothetical protein
VPHRVRAMDGRVHGRGRGRVLNDAPQPAILTVSSNALGRRGLGSRPGADACAVSEYIVSDITADSGAGREGESPAPEGANLAGG